MKRLIIVFGLLCLFSIVQAQEVEIDPRLLLPDESELFTDNVEIIERFRIVRTFDESQEIYIYEPDSRTWSQFDYPPDVPNLMGGFFINEDELILYNFSIEEDSFITLNVLTDEYYEPEDRCGNFNRDIFLSMSLNSGAISPNLWRFHEGNLCNDATLTTYPVPDHIIEAHMEALDEPFVCGFERNPVRFSPNNDYFVFGACSESNHLLYRYDLDTEAVDLIYSISGAERLTIRGWANNETLIFTTGFYLDFLDEYFTEPPGIKLHRVNTGTTETEWITFGSDTGVPTRELNRGAGREKLFFLFNIENNHIVLQSYEFVTDSLSTVFELNCDDFPFSCNDDTIFGGFDPTGYYFVIRSDTYTQDTQYHIFAFESGNLIHTISNKAGFVDSWVSTGQYFWFEQNSANLLASQTLHIVTLDGENVMSDTLHEADTYSSDGQWLAIARPLDGIWTISIEHIESGDETVVFELPISSTIFQYADIEVSLIFRNNLLEIGLIDRTAGFSYVAGWKISLLSTPSWRDHER